MKICKDMPEIIEQENILAQNVESVKNSPMVMKM